MRRRLRCGMSDKQSKSRRHFVYAVIYDRKNHVLSVGTNSYIKTSPLQAKWAAKCQVPLKQFVHAEVCAIAKLKPSQRNKAYAIYVYRFDHHGRPALAKPCIVCETLIRSIGIKRVYYTTENNDLGMSYRKYKQYNDYYADQWDH